MERRLNRASTCPWCPAATPFGEKIEIDNLNLWGLYQWGFWPVHRLAIVPMLILDFLGLWTIGGQDLLTMTRRGDPLDTVPGGA